MNLSGFILVLIILSGNKRLNNMEEILPLKDCTDFSKYSNKLVKRDAGAGAGAGCTATIQFLHCASNAKYSRLIENKFVTNFESSKCDFRHLQFNWKIYKRNVYNKKILHKSFNKYKNREFYLLTPYFLVTGNYTLSVEVWLDRPLTKLTSDDCEIEVRPEVPIAVIKGGTDRYVRPDKDATIDGSQSVNLDYQNDDRKLKYTWECMIITPREKCNGRSLGSFYKISKKQVKPDYYFIVSLTVQSTESGLIDQTEQSVITVSNAVEVEVECMKNCPPKVRAVDPSKLMSLAVTCLQYCEGIPDDAYSWTIDAAGFDYPSNTQYGRHGKLFNINSGVLQFDTPYSISVNLSQPYFATGLIKFTTRPQLKLQSCSITPQTGKALTTEFKISCVYPDGDYSFQIYSVGSSGEEILIDKDRTLDHITFKLAQSDKVLVKILDEFDSSDSYKLDVSVSAMLPVSADQAEVEETVEKAFKNIDDMILRAKTDEIVQTISGISGELKRSPVKSAAMMKSKKIFVKKSIAILEQIEMDSLGKVSQAASLIRNVIAVPGEKSDPEIAESATNICKNLAKKQLELLNNSIFPTTLAQQTKEISSEIMACAEANAPPNSDLLIPEHSYNLTTPFPPAEISELREDYPDYMADDVEERIEKLDKANKNFMEICFLNARALSVTTAPGEATVEKASKLSTVTVTKKSGADMVRSVIRSRGVEVRPSNDAGYVDGLIDIYMCTMSIDPFWWNEVRISSSSVAYITVQINESTIKHFNEPLSLSFNAPSLESGVEVIEGVTPIGGSDSMDFYSIFDEGAGMAVYRIEVLTERGYVIEFFNLTASDLFDVVVTVNRRPKLDDFRQCHEISLNNSKIYKENDEKEESWHYVAILPHSREEHTKFRLGVYTPFCSHWNLEERNWEYVCKSTKETNTTMIRCDCHKLSLLSAVIVNNRVRLEQVYQLDDFTMQPRRSLIVYMSCAISFLLYSLLLVVVTMRKKNESNYYLLADVRHSGSFAYLLEVRTGRSFFSGTTSNVTVRLHGDSGLSNVLTTDSYGRLLQRGGKDRFVLLADRHLGRLEKLEIWHDHLGARPRWNCEMVTVYDLRAERRFDFLVNKWFDVARDVTFLVVRVGEGERKDGGGRFSFARAVSWRWLREVFARKNDWKIFTLHGSDSISSFKRVNLMLSAVSNLFLLAFLFYGYLSFDIGRGFEAAREFQVSLFVIVTGIGSSCLSFIFHTALLYLFRIAAVIDEKIRKEEKMSLFLGIEAKIGWIFMLLNILSSAAILTLFGPGMPTVTSQMWLTSVLIGFLTYVLILENFLICLTQPVLSEQVKSVCEKYKDVSAAVNEQRAHLCQIYGNSLLRPYLKHLYRPLRLRRLKVKKNQATIKKELLERTEDLIMFVVYMVILYWVVLSERDKMTCASYTEVGELVEGIYGPVELGDISSIDSFHEYLEQTLIQTLQSPVWYDTYVLIDPGLVKDASSKYLGVARLRQHRVRGNSCVLPGESESHLSSCYPEYESAPDERDFFENWSLEDRHEKRLGRVWKYRRRGVMESGADEVEGEFGDYPGSGYVFPLGRTLRNSLINYDYLKEKKWIDQRTRCVFVEFLLYDANTNLFNSVQVLVEFSATGEIVYKVLIESGRLFLNEDEISLMVIITSGAFLLIVALMVIKNAFTAIKEKKTYFKNTWRMVDLMIILLSVAIIIFFSEMTKIVLEFMERLQQVKHNEFLSYFHIFTARKVLHFVASLLIFIATLRLWKLLRYRKIFRMLEMTLLEASPAMIALTMYYLTFLTASTFFALTVFGSESTEFQKFFDSSVGLVQFSVGFFEGFDEEELNFWLSYLFYSVLLLLRLTYTTIIAAILIHYYSEAQVRFSGPEDEHDVEDFISEEIDYYRFLCGARLRIRRLRGGRDDPGLVYPKSEEHRYADAVLTSALKIYIMKDITRVIVNFKKKSAYDEIILKKIIAKDAKLEKEDEDEDEMFFKVYDIKTNQMGLVSDLRMRIMEEIVSFLLVSTVKEEATETGVVKNSSKECCKRLDRIKNNLTEQLSVLGSVELNL